jgi:hypothetical protein
MLVDDSLWLPFLQAKTALFAALLDRCQLPSVHVLSAPPSQRQSMRTETNQLIQSLLELEHELADIIGAFTVDQNLAKI